MFVMPGEFGDSSGHSPRRNPILNVANLSFCGLACTFSLTPCFSWGLDGLLTCQPFQRLSADGKPLKAVARLRPPSPTLLKQGVNERAVNTAVRQRWLLAQKLRCAQLGRWSDSCYFIHHFAFA